jgi:hypothetical protein
MLFVIDIILNFVAVFGMGLLAGMSVPGALLTMIIVQAAGMLVGAILGGFTGADGESIGGICLALRIIIIIILAINLFVVPNADERYKPTTVLAGSPDGQPPFEEGRLKNISAGQPYYIRLESDVQVNGWLRRITVKNTVPVSVEFSNADLAEIKIDSDSAGEPSELKIKDGKVVFSFDIVARAKPEKRQITFKVTPKISGEQKVLITYEKRVSKDTAKYTKTLEYIE